MRRDVVLQQMVKYEYLDAAKAKAIKKDTIALDYQYFDHNLGLAPYFRAQVKKELEIILQEYTKEDGSPYDIYNDGLIIHTTLDHQMQQYAEKAMADHLKKLQKDYESAYGSRAPWKTNKKIIANAIKDLPLYKSYKKQGLTEAQILDSLSLKKEMELFDWDKNIVTEASTIDSLQHYLKFLNSGMLSIEPNTGAIRAYLGGIDYRYFQYDHVSQSERQVGSTFKPFVYTAAIENGMKPCTYFSIKEVTYTDVDDWTPKNASEVNDPYLNYNLEKALSNSINTIAVKVFNQVGIPKVLEQVKKLGITKDLPKKPSIVLGTAAIRLRDLAGAYASYVNEGKSVTPYLITKIEDKQGTIIASFEPKVSENPAYSDYTRQIMLKMMQSTVETGTASRLRNTYQLQNDIAGKTGTTQNNKDGWFVGITPKLVTVTWVGNDNFNIGFSNTKLGQGANSALPIFAKLTQQMNQDPAFDIMTKSRFEKLDSQVLDDLTCASEKRDGFFKRLFGKKKRKKRFGKRK